jgi:hypothetical protein
VKVLLALQVLGGDLAPIQVGVSTDPDLIRQFVTRQRAELRGRKQRVPTELEEGELRLNEAKEAVLDTILDLVCSEPTSPHTSDEQHPKEGRGG